MADPLDHLRLRRFLGRGLGPALRLLPQVHPPRVLIARQLRRRPARGDRRRLRYARRAAGRCGDRPPAEELGVGLYRALEHAARLRVRLHRGVHARGRRARREETVAALRIQGLKKAFGGLPAINDVSLEVAAGERRLIIGPNGAGKTTLFNLLTGDLPRDAGSIALFDEEVSRFSTSRRCHRGLARTYQIITLFPNDTLEHNVALSLLGLSRERWKMFGRVSPSFFEQARLPLGGGGVGGAGRPGRAAGSLGGRGEEWKSPWPARRSPGSCCWTSRSRDCRARSARR